MIHKDKQKSSQPIEEQPPTTTCISRFPCLPSLLVCFGAAIVAGILAGFLGIGGGMVIGPLMLQFGMLPLVRSSAEHVTAAVGAFGVILYLAHLFGLCLFCLILPFAAPFSCRFISFFACSCVPLPFDTLRWRECLLTICVLFRVLVYFCFVFS